MKNSNNHLEILYSNTREDKRLMVMKMDGCSTKYFLTFQKQKPAPATTPATLKIRYEHSVSFSFRLRFEFECEWPNDNLAIH